MTLNLTVESFKYPQKYQEETWIFLIINDQNDHQIYNICLYPQINKDQIIQLKENQTLSYTIKQYKNGQFHDLIAQKNYLLAQRFTNQNQDIIEQSSNHINSKGTIKLYFNRRNYSKNVVMVGRYIGIQNFNEPNKILGNAQKEWRAKQQKIIQQERVKKWNIQHGFENVQPKQKYTQFYKGPCKTVNLFSILDPPVQGQKFNLMQYPHE